jgi:hypothetical protein
MLSACRFLAEAALAEVIPAERSVTHGDGLSLAQTNGTILAIIFAAIFGYLLIVFEAIDRLRTELVEQAHAINRIRYSVHFKSEAINTAGMSPTELGEAFYALSLGGQPEGVADDSGSRGLALCAVASTAATSHPFAEARVATEADAREWLAEIEDVLPRFRNPLIPAGGNHIPELAEAAQQAYRRTDEEEFERRRAEVEALGYDLERWLVRQDRGEWAKEALAEFEALIWQAQEVMQETRFVLDRLDRYRRRALPQRSERVRDRVAAGVALLALFAAFVCGVIVAMLDQDASHYVDAWVPAVAYLSCLALGGYYLVTRVL